MWKSVVGFFVGLIVLALGVTSFTIGLQYASFLQANIEAAAREDYEYASRLFGYGGYVLLLFGVILVAWSIRRYLKVRREKMDGANA